MHNDSAEILNDILSRWHSWAKNYKANQQTARDPIFRNAKSGRGWDHTDEIIEDEIHGSMMEAVDFQVSEMADPYRSTIHVLARNLSTGRNVWLSPRVPQDAMERAQIISTARTLLTNRLMNVGVM
jgi:hypothetical protein